MKTQVTELGSGAPVVMLHSGGMSSRQWARLATRLAPRFRTLSMNFLGYGESDPAGEAFRVEDDLQAALALIDAQSEPVHLVGHSYGGLVALWAARARRVRTLTLCEPVAFGVLHSRGDAEGLAELGDDATFGQEPGSEAWLSRFVDYWNGKGAWKSLPGPSRDAFLRVGTKVYQEVAGIMADRTSHEDYRAVDAPTLIVCGDRTTLAERHVCTILAETLPRAELRMVEGAGHMAPLTHADVVNRAIEAHLGA